MLHIIAKETSVVHQPQSATVQVISDRVALQILTNASGGGGSSQAIKIPFGYGDASPKPIQIVQGLIFKATLAIVNPFNASAALSIGDEIDSGRILGVNQNLPSLRSNYESNPLVNYISPVQLFLNIQLGEGVTSGDGYVVLEVI